MLKNNAKRIKGILLGPMYIIIYYLITFLTQTGFVLWQKNMDRYSTAEIQKNLINSSYALGVVAAIITIWIYMIIGRFRKEPLHKVVKSEKNVPVMTGMAVCLAIGMRLLVMVLFYFSQNVEALKNSIDEASALSPMLTTDVQLAVAAFAVVVVLPFFEEILFRGIVMGEYLKIFRPWAAIVIQALLFGAAHMALFQSIFTFGVGIAFGLVYYKTQSVKISAICHGVFNLMVVLAGIPTTDKSLILYLAFGVLLVAYPLLYIIRYGKNIK